MSGAMQSQRHGLGDIRDALRIGMELDFEPTGDEW